MLDAGALVEAATVQTGLAEFGAPGWREGLDRLIDSLNGESGLSALGEQILGGRLAMLLANRLRILGVLGASPEIADEEVEGPLFIIGLPRTGTTALSNLVAADPQIRSVRLWESSDPVPPPETATEATDPRIDAARAGLEAMYEMFPKMRSLHFQTATGPTECQDLLGMEFRTEHFGGMA
ncbi:MAG TPA: sulfotransferase, partial [Acidimicrobiales bacterium]|nr:sulfotransferase [Acidimicrobiales bacterium]